MRQKKVKVGRIKGELVSWKNIKNRNHKMLF